MCVRLTCLLLFARAARGFRVNSSSSSFARKYEWPGKPPDPALFEDGASDPEKLGYEHPYGAGCVQSKKPETGWFKSGWNTVWKPAKSFNVEGWSGFCQLGWSLCSDAALNKDYMYYAKGVGPDWVKMAGPVDKIYCANNGWLEPEIRSIVHDFDKLQTKGKELCAGEYAGEVQDSVGALGLFKFVHEVLSVKGSKKAAAWNCALGDVSCDIAYCNYAYCKKPDGTIGTTTECEGWDKVNGMPRGSAADDA